MIFNLYCISGWTDVPVIKKMYTPWDLEVVPLQIMTDSEAGSDETIWVEMRENSSAIGYVWVKFSSPMQYYINPCTSSTTDLPVQPPVVVDNNIWTITKTEAAIIITCNGDMVLNYLFANSSNSDCVTKWSGDVVEQISFNKEWDKASDFYREGKSLDLIF